MVLVDDMDYVTGMSSVIATLMNIGPGFGTIGPSENYAHISAVGKWFLSWNMLVGRLEVAGTSQMIDGFIQEIGDKKIIEVARSGFTALEK